MLRIVQAATETELEDARALFREFVAWHRAQHVEDLHLIERYFGSEAFEAELAGLPGSYAPPDGRLLVAYQDDAPAGTVALRRLDDGVCEMKRMFVPDRFRGKGIGGALAEDLILDARASGYRLMRLDTSHRQKEAMNLYKSLGFLQVEPYHDLPADLKDWLVFFEKQL